MATVPALELKDVRRHFGGLAAVDGVSLRAERGLVTALVGPNGAGKTTVFNLISGLLEPDSGAILLEGIDIAGLAPHRIARRGVGRTFQDPRIFYEMSVLDHVIAGLSLKGENPVRAALRDPGMRRETKDARAKALALLGEIGLAARANDKAQDLSFGEQRFLSIARSLAADPQLLLLDEPTVGLDRGAIGELTTMVLRLVRERGKSVVIIEHNLDVIFELSDRIHLLVNGKVALSGEPAEIKRHPRMIEAYLGAKYAAID
jgi:ABC-type branched-subunit amino acid transport system ATPase component